MADGTFEDDAREIFLSGIRDIEIPSLDELFDINKKDNRIPEPDGDKFPTGQIE
jgi:hypothetical protein